MDLSCQSYGERQKGPLKHSIDYIRCTKNNNEKNEKRRKRDVIEAGWC